MTTLDELSASVRVAGLMADAARAAIHPHFRATSGVTAENKSSGGGADFDPVTAADRAAEAAMRAVLAEHRPDDGILGEEFASIDGVSGRLWVVDPIDGTRAFMSGLLHWGVLIALTVERRAIVGVLDQPYVGERFIGIVGADGVLAEMQRGDETQPIRTRACADLSTATLVTTDPDLFAAGAERDAFDALAGRVRLRRFGSDCYGYAMLAAGCVDIVVETGLAPYDIQAMVPIVEAAGGVVTDWSGRPNPWSGRILAAGDPQTHAAALEILAGVE